MCGQRLGYNAKGMNGGIGYTWGSIISYTSYMILSKLLNLLNFGFLSKKIGGNCDEAI